MFDKEKNIDFMVYFQFLTRICFCKINGHDCNLPTSPFVSCHIILILLSGTPTPWYRFQWFFVMFSPTFHGELLKSNAHMDFVLRCLLDT